jgi:hypothetical protein
MQPPPTPPQVSVGLRVEYESDWTSGSKIEPDSPKSSHTSAYTSEKLPAHHRPTQTSDPLPLRDNAISQELFLNFCFQPNISPYAWKEITDLDKKRKAEVHLFI